MDDLVTEEGDLVSASFVHGRSSKIGPRVEFVPTGGEPTGARRGAPRKRSVSPPAAAGGGRPGRGVRGGSRRGYEASARGEGGRGALNRTRGDMAGGREGTSAMASAGIGRSGARDPREGTGYRRALPMRAWRFLE